MPQFSKEKPGNGHLNSDANSFKEHYGLKVKEIGIACVFLDGRAELDDGNCHG